MDMGNNGITCFRDTRHTKDGNLLWKAGGGRKRQDNQERGGVCGRVVRSVRWNCVRVNCSQFCNIIVGEPTPKTSNVPCSLLVSYQDVLWGTQSCYQWMDWRARVCHRTCRCPQFETSGVCAQDRFWGMVAVANL